MPHFVPLDKDLDLELLIILHQIHDEGKKVVKIVALPVIVMAHLRGKSRTQANIGYNERH